MTAVHSALSGEIGSISVMPPIRGTPRQHARTNPLPNFLIQGSSLFDRLPIELLQQIGLEFHQPNDLYKFARICRATFNALDRDDKHFWRLRFLKTFDQPAWPQDSNARRNNAHYKTLFLARQAVLCGDRALLGFTSGRHNDEMEALLLLRELLVEAVPAADGKLKNIDVVLRFVNRLHCFEMFHTDDEELFQRDRSVDRLSPSIDNSTYWHPLLLMMHCMLAPMTLSSKNRWKVLDFYTSQAIVYASSDARPLVHQGAVSFETVLHHINFWTAHLLKDTSGAIVPWYKILAHDERPRFWSTKLSSNDLSFSKAWKGTYAYLDDEDHFKYGADGVASHHLQDEFLGEGASCPFQDITLELCDAAQHYWPDVFELHVPTTRNAARVRTRAQGRSFQEPAEQIQPLPVRGEGVDQGERFLMSGWIEQLPDQMGVPGWRRLVLVKYYTDDDTGVVDEDALWAYEGIVLPGNMMVVGRWWYPSIGVHTRHAYRGPFILWAVKSMSLVDEMADSQS